MTSQMDFIIILGGVEGSLGGTYLTGGDGIRLAWLQDFIELIHLLIECRDANLTRAINHDSRKELPLSLWIGPCPDVTLLSASRTNGPSLRVWTEGRDGHGGGRLHCLSHLLDWWWFLHTSLFAIECHDFIRIDLWMTSGGWLNGGRH